MITCLRALGKCQLWAIYFMCWMPVLNEGLKISRPLRHQLSCRASSPLGHDSSFRTPPPPTPPPQKKKKQTKNNNTKTNKQTNKQKKQKQKNNNNNTPQKKTKTKAKNNNNKTKTKQTKKQKTPKKQNKQKQKQTNKKHIKWPIEIVSDQKNLNPFSWIRDIVRYGDKTFTRVVNSDPRLDHRLIRFFKGIWLARVCAVRWLIFYTSLYFVTYCFMVLSCYKCVPSSWIFANASFALNVIERKLYQSNFTLCNTCIWKLLYAFFVYFCNINCQILHGLQWQWNVFVKLFITLSVLLITFFVPIQ